VTPGDLQLSVDASAVDEAGDGATAGATDRSPRVRCLRYEPTSVQLIVEESP
jgi:hypothetical protein